jgi:L-lactate dehydrogenase complex protein LldG
MTDSRSKILEKIRIHSSPESDITSGGEDFSSLFPDAEIDVESQLRRFRAEFARISGVSVIVSSAEEAISAIVEIVRQEKCTNIVFSRHSILRELELAARLLKYLPDCSVGGVDVAEREGGLRERIERSDVGITGADFLIADTGTIATHSFSDESRLVSLLPPIHIVVATSLQLVPTLYSAQVILGEKMGPVFPYACLTLITGPSRTADIEKELVLGVHGPKKLFAIVLT